MDETAIIVESQYKNLTKIVHSYINELEWKTHIWNVFNTMLKPKRHSLRCHDFMVHV